VHGGAWAIPDEMVDAHLDGVRAAIAAGWSVLNKGGSAVDAVEEAVVIMENDDAFDAGRGSFLNRDGKVQLDALIMDGATLRAGGVGCVEHIANPVRAARKVLGESPHVYFVAEGAERFAQEHGIPLCENEDLILPREIERLRALQSSTTKTEELFAPTISHDTVGAVALDTSGDIAAATSTGGTLNKAPGRLGDSSLIGCGCYADNQSAAVSTTGWGEPIMKLVLAKWAANAPLAFIDQYIGNLRQYKAISIDVGDQDGLKVGAGKMHEILDQYGIANTFEIYKGTHTSAVADRFQNHVIPFFSKNLCSGRSCN